MKLVTIGTALCLLAAAGFAGQSGAEEKGWKTDLSSALAMAKKTHKLVMVDFSATWCGPCQMYKNQVFPTAQFKNATKNVILVAIDVDKQPAASKKYQINSIPDIRFLTGTGKELGKVVGFEEGPRFLDDLKRAKSRI